MHNPAHFLKNGRRWLFWFQIQAFLITALIGAAVLSRDRLHADGTLLLWVAIPTLIGFWVAFAAWFTNIVSACLVHMPRYLGLLRSDDLSDSLWFRNLPTWLLIPSWLEHLTHWMDERRHSLDIRSGLGGPHAIVHEVSNPLQVIKSGLDFATADLPHHPSLRDTDFANALARAKHAADGLADYLSDLRAFISGQPAHTFDLWHAVRAAFSDEPDITLDPAHTAPLHVVGYQPIVLQALAHIIRNARAHGPAPADIVITQDPDKHPAIPPTSHSAILAIYDRGRPLTAEEAYLAFHFDPATTAATGSLGFGLSYFRAVMRHQRGDLRFTYLVDPTPLGALGSGMVLSLPRADPATARHTHPNAQL